MARWRLMASHYLNLEPGVQWQHVEQDMATGAQARKTYIVPKLLDINDPRSFNDPDGIIVSDGKDAKPRDYIFLGDPTPDMEPLDDDARMISDSLLSRGQHPIESLPPTGSLSPLPEPKRRA